MPILLILLVANFANSFSQISDTTLLYHRRPRSSLAVSLFGALLSISLSLLLVPRYHALGAAIAIVCTFTAMTLLSHWLAWRLTAQSYLSPLLGGLATAAGLAAAALWLPMLGWPTWLAMGAKLSLFASLAYVIGRRYFRP